MDSQVLDSIIKSLSSAQKAELCGAALTLITSSADELAQLDLGKDIFYSRRDFLAAGCTFDEELLFNMGKTDAASGFEKGSAFSGAVNIGVMRDPMSQNACEMFSEDPLVVKQLAESYIRGAGGNVIAYGILGGGGAYAERYFDKRALKEIYLKPLIDLGALIGAVEIPGGMINGELVYESADFINLLKRCLKPDALIINALATNTDLAASVKAGAGYSIPHTKKNAQRLLGAVSDGTLDEAQLDIYVKRIAAFMLSAKDKMPLAPSYRVYDVNKNLAEKSIVLLKNESCLPLDNFFNRLYLCGDISEEIKRGFDKADNFVISPPDGDYEIKVVFSYCKDGFLSPGAMRELKAERAEKSKVILAAVSGGAFDASEFSLADAVFFIPAVLPDTFKILSDMLCGKLSPSGRLPFSWAKTRRCYPASLLERIKERGEFCYESTYVGYRYFVGFDAPCEYIFGHGLSYAEPDITVSKLKSSCDAVQIYLTLKNDSSHAYEGVIFAFDNLDSKAAFGLKTRLIGFKRVCVGAQSTTDVHMSISADAFNAYDKLKKAFVSPAVKHTVRLGFSACGELASFDLKIPKKALFDDGLDAKKVPSYFPPAPFPPRGQDIELVMETLLYDKPHGNFAHTAPAKPNKKTLKTASKKIAKALGKNHKIEPEKMPPAVLKTLAED